MSEDTEFTDDNELTDAVDQYMYFKRLRDENDSFMRLAQEKIVKISEREQKKVMSVHTSQHGDQTLSVVSSETLVYDLDKFKETVGEKWDDLTVTTTKVNSAKVRSEVLEGRLDAKIVADCTTIKKSAPYIRISNIAIGNES